jgi:hypothetical protein
MFGEFYFALIRMGLRIRIRNTHPDPDPGVKIEIYCENRSFETYLKVTFLSFFKNTSFVELNR